MAAKPAYGDDDTAYIGKLVGWFEDAEEATDKSRKSSEQCRDYYDGRQLTAKEAASLKERGQPDIIINRVQPKIDYLLGFEASSRTDPRCYPRNEKDEDAAEAATDALRYVEDTTRLDQKFSNVWEQMLIEGFGGLELIVDEASGEIDVVEWDWDRLFYDPHSRKPDFSDARYLGGVIWMDADEAKEKWPEAADKIDLTLNEQTFTRTYDDRPWAKWVSGKQRNRVRIVQMYHKEGGVWKWCIFTKGGKIDGGDVPFVDQKGMSWCPMMLQSAYVNRDNERYGLVKIMIGPQDEINKRRSKALHMLTVKQVVMEIGAVDDVDMLRTELAKPDGVIQRNPGFELEINRDDQNLQGHLNLLQEAKNEIELIGPNAAMLGKGQGDPSGRAILANQQGGQTELSRILDRHLSFKRRVFAGLWDLIRAYKKEEWWVRVTDDEKKAKFIGFNRPITMGEQMGRDLEKKGLPPEEIAAQLEQAMQDPIMAEQLQQHVGIENVPAEMDMDISIEAVPDVANLAAEQFQGLIELAKVGVVMPPKAYIKASNLRNKQDVLDEMEKMEQKPDPQAMQMQMEAAMAQLRELNAKIAKLEAETIKTLVEADMASQPMNQITTPQIVSNGAAQPQQPAPQQAGFQ
ncbi:MAG: hypothetical protein K2X00_10920 [Nitrospiraceae bacterium]|nr:hypothetical protein [Nitrospiraceae bacterium]